MNPSSETSPPTIDEQASLWAARIEEGALSELQCAELDAWLIAHPAHREALAEYCDLSAGLDHLLPQLNLAAEPLATEVGPGATRASRPHRWWWLATGLAAAACLALFFKPATTPADGLERIATAIAECQTVLLSDGTQVELNAHTNLVFQSTTTERRVRLGGGQAFFVVTKDAARPFIVDTPLGSVRVTGTAFDVRTLSAQSLAITVAEGAVEVRLGENDQRSASAPIQLTPGDQLRSEAGESRVVSLTDDELARELAWREGQLALDNAPLAAVLERFAHYHGIGISAEPAVAQLALSGRFTLADLDNFLLALETVHPVRVIRDQSGTIRVVARD